MESKLIMMKSTVDYINLLAKQNNKIGIDMVNEINSYNVIVKDTYLILN